jgi:nucleotide-binding universal stress UspA family protein
MACILACIDFSDVSERVLATGAKLSHAHGIELVALHVAAPDPEFVGYEVGPQSVRDQLAGQLREQHRELGARVAALVGQGLRARPLMVQGVTAECINEHAQRLGAELLVLGSHGHGKLHQLLVGSVADAVLRRARVPVVLVPAGAA